MVNETLKTVRDPDGVHDEAVQEYEGYEHAHWALRYRWEATRAGLFDRSGRAPLPVLLRRRRADVPPETGRLRALGLRLGFAMRSNGLARRLYLAWLNHVWGGVSMNMIATKPVRYVGWTSG